MIGTAIALNLLFGIPLIVGVTITVIDVLVILMFQYKGFRYLESIVAGLMAVIISCFTYEIFVSNPDFIPILSGLLPSSQIVYLIYDSANPLGRKYLERLELTSLVF